ncbi:MAG: (d)CMP kinase [Candidatus Bathyarchaeota archaeon]|nr:(d)CMP kinase [Candidatus Bathyarchaeota archaeon]
MSPFFVHFFGPDGSGKSTQADLLTAYLKTKNVKTRKYWLRSPHTLAFLLWELSIKVGFLRVVSNASGAYIKIPAVNRSRIVSQVWALIELISVAPLVVRAQLYLLSGYTLVAERYLLDTIAFVAFSIGDKSFPHGQIAKLFLALIPAGTKFVFIDADYDTITQRRARFLEQKPVSENTVEVKVSSIKTELEPREFIDFQREIYRTLAQEKKALIVDTSRHSQEEAFNMILAYLDPL